MQWSVQCVVQCPVSLCKRYSNVVHDTDEVQLRVVHCTVAVSSCVVSSCVVSSCAVSSCVVSSCVVSSCVVSSCILSSFPVCSVQL